MNQGLKSALLGLVILASLGWLTFYYVTQPKPGDPVEHELPAACASCGKAYIASLGRQPARCVLCKKETLYRAIQCADEKCRTLFPLVMDSSKPYDEQPEVEIRCPKCGGKRYITEIAPDAVSRP